MYPKITGKWYEAEVPDTLDLAERAGLAVNGMGGCIDPELMTMFFHINFCCDRPFFSHWGSAGTTCDTKFGESFPLMRIMSGSDQYADLEAQFRKELVSRIEDGLYWDRYDPRRPWRNVYAPAFSSEGRDEDFAVSISGRMIRALMVWSEAGGGEVCERLVDELTDGMSRIAIRKDDYCYYPTKGGWGEPFTYPKSGWINTDEPLGETEGGEGSVVGYHGHQIYGASQWYAKTGDPVALDLATRLTNFCMLPKFWGGVPDPDGDRTGLAGQVAPGKPDPAFTAGSELGHWYSHFHARAIGLRGILEYGRATGDERALEFVQRAYEFTLSQGIPRIGWINCFPGALNMVEACALGDLTALGIRLSDCGLGDYWDNVDSVVRNHLLEQQLTRTDLLENIVNQFTGQLSDKETGEYWQYPGQLNYDNVIARSIGVFGGLSTPSSIKDLWVMNCCTGNATQGLYYGWEGIVREDGDNAQINLLLNRASKLVDIDSCLPYEGKVVVHNKSAKRISIRIPEWVTRKDLRIQVNNTDRPKDFVGNFIIIEDLNPGDKAILTFPIKEYTTHHTINANSSEEQVYTCKFRGGTLVDISPRDDSKGSYPMYLRDYLKTGGSAPMKTVRRFVSDNVVRNW